MASALQYPALLLLQNSGSKVSRVCSKASISYQQYRPLHYIYTELSM